MTRAYGKPARPFELWNTGNYETVYWQTEGLNLHTYNSYDGELSYEPIDEGYEMEILLSVYTHAYPGKMFAPDLSSGKSIGKEIRLSGDPGCVDQTQEQHSFHSVWTPTEKAHHFDNVLRKGYNEEVWWTYDVPTAFYENPPLHFEEEMGEKSIGMVTWCV